MEVESFVLGAERLGGHLKEGLKSDLQPDICGVGFLPCRLSPHPLVICR
ncbi:hypothetical protein scyTo_0024862, partial [Scyliorhinus torazame]|nr:hypothetical protein [Scyliorhinus torazame]